MFGYGLNNAKEVHGDIRHLENLACELWQYDRVHGDIRHLETCMVDSWEVWSSSWRHTPFRNDLLEGAVEYAA